VAKVLGLFDAMTGLIVEASAFALFVHEHSRAWLLHPLLCAGDVLVGDRGFCSYVQLALLAERGVLAVFRMRSTQIVSFRPHRRHFCRGGAEPQAEPAEGTAAVAVGAPSREARPGRRVDEAEVQ
jgi:hypothetical protein